MKEFFRVEWAKLKELDFAGKRQYIWEYYKLHFFAFAIVFFLLWSIISAWLNPDPGEFIYIAWFGPPTSHEQLDVMMDVLSEIVPYQEHEVVRVTNYAMGGADPQVAMAMQTRLFAFLQGGMIDVFMASKEEIEGFSGEGVLRPVDEVLAALAQLNPEVYRQAQERLLTVSFTLMDEEYVFTEAMGISMYGAAFFEALGIRADDLYLGVVFNSEKDREIAYALEVILNG